MIAQYLRGRAISGIALTVFFGAVLAVLAVLYRGTGHHLPLEADSYHGTVTMQDVDNLVSAGTIQQAGVKIGQVDSVTLDGSGGVKVDFELHGDAAPLHEGAKLRVGTRSLVGETYLELTDGNGPEIPSGSTLPASAVERGVQLHDVLASLDESSRGQLRDLLRSTGAATEDTGTDVNALMSSLGNLGRNGNVALDALASQSQDIRALSRQTVQVLDALDGGEGQIASMVRSANALTKATSGQSEAVRSTMRELPGVLASARTASDSLGVLAGALDPVAKDLKAAGPNLTIALNQLPDSTRNLRLMLPPLSKVLDRAPATLNRVPTTASDLDGLIPTAQSTLADVNPMLAFVQPYGPDLAAYIANFNAVLNYRDENGSYYLRLTPLVNTHSPQVPLKTDGLLGNYTNPYPAPGSGPRPGPFTGQYPHLEPLAR